VVWSDARNRDVVLEASRHRLVQAVHHAEHAVTGVDGVDHDTKTVDVDDLVQGHALLAHLLVDAVEVFLAPLDPRLDSRSLDGGAQRIGDLADELLLVAARALELTLDHAIAPRVQRLEAELLQLELDAVEPEPLGDRRVDVECLERDAATFWQRHGIERAHVVCAVRELHQDHADVAHHGEQHLAEALGLRLLATLELDLVELGDGIDQLGDVLAELLGDLFLGGRRVLDDVVQDRRDDGLGVHVQVGEHIGRGDGMRDVGLAREALLAAMRGGAEFICLLHPFHLVGWQVVLELRDELADAERAARAAGQQVQQ
jgi:hypothetical protein